MALSSSESTKYHLPAGEKGTFVALKVRLGSSVVHGQPLMVYKDDSGHEQKLKARDEGVVVYISNSLLPGAEIDDSQLVCSVRGCEHSVVMKDMCADCGKDLRKADGLPGDRAESSKANVPMIHSIPELHVSPQVAMTHGSADEANLLKQRKLVLLVDLDQTVIHTTNEIVKTDIPDVTHYQLYGQNSVWYHTRLRPNTRQFLQTISTKYELHICTFGQRVYAHKVAAILDPDKKLFGSRILSRDECFDQMLKTANLRSLFPHGDHMVVVIDDREDVWNYATNVVQVKPYRFFKETGDINAPIGFSKAGVSHDVLSDMVASTLKTDSENAQDDVNENEKPEASNNHVDLDEDHDDYLVHLEDILERLHDAFYTFYDKESKNAGGDDCKVPDMNILLPYVKRTVLQGVRLLFSGVIPTNMPLQQAPICSMVKSFGAVVHEQLVPPDKSGSGEPTTHVIAARWGTSKVHQASKYPKIHIVQPQWLWTCLERWQRVDERLYPLHKNTAIDPSSFVGKLGRRPQSRKRKAAPNESKDNTPEASDSDAAEPSNMELNESAIVDPADVPAVIEQVQDGGGDTSDDTNSADEGDDDDDDDEFDDDMVNQLESQFM